MSFAKNFGSKYGKKILDKGFSSSKRIKDTGSKFNQSMAIFKKNKEVNLVK